MKRADITGEILDKARELQEAGEKAKAVQIATGLDHSQEAYVRYLSKYNQDGSVLVEPTPKNIEALYDFYSVSVGGIMALCGTASDGLWALSPAAVDKLYQAATGFTLKGKRCGKGGAYLQHDSKLYEGALRKTGVALTPAEVRNPDARSTATAKARGLQEAMAMEVPAIRAALEDLGTKVPAKRTKAQLAMLYAEAVSV